MAGNLVTLTVEDSGFNQKLKNAADSMNRFGERLKKSAEGSKVFSAGIASVKQSMDTLNASLKANAIIAVSQAIMDVGAAMLEWATGAKAAAAEFERLEEEQEKARKKLEETTKAYVDASAQSMNMASRISSLQVAYKNANSEMEKTNILKQAQTEFKKLGLECKGVADAQNLLVSRGNDIIEMIRAQGDVAALSAMRMTAYKKSFQMLLENGYGVEGAASLAGNNADVRKFDDMINQRQSRIQSIQGTLPMKTSGRSKKAKDIFASDSIAAQEELVSKLTKKWRNCEAALRDGYKKQLDEAQQKLDEMLGKQKKIETVIGMSGATDKSISAWISGQKGTLGNLQKGSSEYLSVYENIADAQRLDSILNKAIKNNITISPDTIESLWEQILGGENIPDSVWKNLEDDINSMLKDLGIISPLQSLQDELNTLRDNLLKSPDSESYKRNQKAVREKEKEIERFQGRGKEANISHEIGNMAGGISTMVNSLNQLGVDLPNGLGQVVSGIQLVTTLLGGITTILTAIQTIETADFFKFFANGGIVRAAGGAFVPGNSYSGDHVPALLNSGELVLNKAQQGNLASQLEGGALGNLRLSATITGEQIRLALNNNGKRTGRGEIVQSRFRG